MPFKLSLDYQPRGDQATAIQQLIRGISDGEKHQVLLGVTGSGKTFTMAKIDRSIRQAFAGPCPQQNTCCAALPRIQRLFPNECGRVFRQLLRLLSAGSLHSVGRCLHRKGSHHQRRTGQTAPLGHQIAIRAARLRNRRKRQLHLRLGSPEAYYGMLLMLEKGQQITRKELLQRLVEILYERNDHDFRRGTFRVRGDVVELYPTYDDNAYRIELWGDEIESLSQIDPIARPGANRHTYGCPSIPRRTT